MTKTRRSFEAPTAPRTTKPSTPPKPAVAKPFTSGRTVDTPRARKQRAKTLMDRFGDVPIRG